MRPRAPETLDEALDRVARELTSVRSEAGFDARMVQHVGVAAARRRKRRAIGSAGALMLPLVVLAAWWSRSPADDPRSVAIDRPAAMARDERAPTPPRVELAQAPTPPSPPLVASARRADVDDTREQIDALKSPTGLHLPALAVDALNVVEVEVGALTVPALEVSPVDISSYSGTMPNADVSKS
jgi:hypothetical protein